MLASNDADLIAAAQTWRKRAGGNLFTSVYQVVDDERGFNENIGRFAGFREKMIAITETVAKATERFEVDGRPIVSFNPARAQCCQIHTWFEGFTEEELHAARTAVRDKEGIDVFRRLRPKKRVDVRDPSDPSSTEIANSEDEGTSSASTTHIMEWSVTSLNEHVDVEVYVKGFVALCQELTKASR